MNQISRSLLFCFTLLGGCSSVQELHYYHLPQVATVSQPESTQAPVLVVDPVLVAGYLNTNALILQLSDVQLFKTNQHQWAEALDQQLTRVLIQQLAQQLPEFRVTDRAAEAAYARLFVQVEQFHGTEQGQVKISGRFSLTQAHHRTEQRFSLQLAQPEAGYPSLVATLALGWQQTAMSISQLLKPDVKMVK